MLWHYAPVYGGYAAVDDRPSLACNKAMQHDCFGPIFSIYYGWSMTLSGGLNQ